MIEITYLQLFLFITFLWIAARFAVAVKTKTFSAKQELKMLLVYICIVVICRFVYFGFHLEDGKIPTLKFGLEEDLHDMISLIPFYFLTDRYDGWQMNIIGNIAMFIPVGIVWPVCFGKLDTILKAIIAGAGFSLFIEVSQLVCIGRHTDIDDLILNSTGAAIGVCIVFLIRRIKKGFGQKKETGE
ncbi:MAG: VanZ family protein [Lachnospiraceae bacterium]|nr:VanZ family protein [Lachnospiraceae bacterium]